MKDKIVLITGATDGIGQQTAMVLALTDATVIIHGRNSEKANRTVEKIGKESGKLNIEAAFADLSSLQEIRKFADDIRMRFDKLDVLINNAGVFMNERQLSKDGIELTFAINHLSYFLLSGLVLDLLKKSDYARIINVASMAHASALDFDNLQGEKYYEGYDAYARSKLCNILFTYKLSNMLQDTHVTANCLHPGVIRTKLLHAGWGGGGSSLEQGAKTSVYLATSPEVKGISGKYFANSQIMSPSSISNDLSVQERLWQVSEEMCGFEYPG